MCCCVEAVLRIAPIIACISAMLWCRKPCTLRFSAACTHSTMICVGDRDEVLPELTADLDAALGQKRVLVLMQ